MKKNVQDLSDALALEFTRDLLRTKTDPEINALVARTSARWSQDLPARNELELLSKVTRTALVTVGTLMTTIRAMREVSPLADELAERLVDLGLEAVDEAINQILRAGRSH